LFQRFVSRVRSAETNPKQNNFILFWVCFALFCFSCNSRLSVVVNFHAPAVVSRWSKDKPVQLWWAGPSLIIFYRNSFCNWHTYPHVKVGLALCTWKEVRVLRIVALGLAPYLNATVHRVCSPDVPRRLASPWPVPMMYVHCTDRQDTMFQWPDNHLCGLPPIRECKILEKWFGLIQNFVKGVDWRLCTSSVFYCYSDIVFCITCWQDGRYGSEKRGQSMLCDL